jgi:hypothetical protein
MRATKGKSPVAPLSLVAIAFLVSLALSATPAHAQSSGSYTYYTTVIEYSTSSGYTPNNVNITWTNTNGCGSFIGTGPGASWYYAPNVGASPCTSSLPSGTVNETIYSQDGTMLASCADNQGAATYGSDTLSSSPPPECTTAGTGVTIDSFFAQAYDANGNAIAASSNYDWLIALVIVIIVILLLLIYYMRRRRRTKPVATAAQASATAPSATT